MNNEDNSNTNPPKKPSWTKPKKLSLKQEDLIELAILGHTNSFISEKLGYTPQHVARLIKSQEIQARIIEARKTRSDIVREKINGLSGLALASVEEILTDVDEKGSTKLATAQFILEQIIGKAKGTEAPQTTNLVQVIQMIENMPRNNEPKPKDEWDIKMSQILDEVIPKGLIIGKRTL